MFGGETFRCWKYKERTYGLSKDSLRIRMLVRNKKIGEEELKDWHCIGGTLSKRNQAGMWIIITIPFTLITDENQIILEIQYDGGTIAAPFDLEKSIYERLESFSIVNVDSILPTGSSISRILPFDAQSQLLTSSTPRSAPINITMSYFQYPTDMNGGIKWWMVLLIILVVVESFLIIIHLLIVLGRYCLMVHASNRITVEMRERRSEMIRRFREQQLVE
ncbi:hypothetical protein RB195_026165 [Necator americanus]|uniref:Uncharacterized protein n=1 Tax=Necator americanus TaxID=51031 RepID=A0ABR1EVP1_NECAM